MSVDDDVQPVDRRPSGVPASPVPPPDPAPAPLQAAAGPEPDYPPAPPAGLLVARPVSPVQAMHADPVLPAGEPVVNGVIVPGDPEAAAAVQRATAAAAAAERRSRRSRRAVEREARQQQQQQQQQRAAAGPPAFRCALKRVPGSTEIGVIVEGLEVTRVFPGSPADAAGVREGMIWQTVQRQSVSDYDSLMHALSAAPAEFEATLLTAPEPAADGKAAEGGGPERPVVRRETVRSRVAAMQEMFPGLSRDVIKLVVQSRRPGEEQINALLQMQQERDLAQAAPEARPAAPADAPPDEGPPRRIGDAVDALFGGEWFPAVIHEVHQGGDLTVQWTEDGSVTLVAQDEVRDPQPRAAAAGHG